ncbi:type VI secretion system ATPase TssH [Pseudacidovorax intermedius]|uniref:type VI secretion system ATPase TssH n=1 Tax=Pseudacidovorax intermedius TaxID=433924 RepID=UPI0009E782F6|nr:type VI secretion system ATPase TssH [Pseudacidovorax intermedius]
MAISRRALFGKLNTTLFRAIESAAAFARLRGNPYVEVTHWLHQLWQAADSDMHRVVRHFDIRPDEVDAGLAAALAALPAGASSLTDISHHVSEAVEQAWVVASLEFGGESIRSAWLLVAMLQAPERRAQLLRIVPALRRIDAQRLVEALPAITQDSPESREGAQAGGAAATEPAAADGPALAGATGGGASALDRYCTDLTARAREGRIDPVIGRQLEVRGLVDILLRRRQNNPLLTGEAGVGKTAVVEGLALAIARGEVPPALANHRLLGVDLGAMLAGAGVRGEFESRLKALLEAATQAVPPVILFVDEVHTLVGAGGQAGTGDAANLLKPALARGALRTIGATTWAEYKRHIEKDPALTRRFQVLQVAEPGEELAIEMVRGLTGAFAAHHGVLILDEAIRAAVTLSRRYLPARQLPDKAISLLDTACARVALSVHAPPAAVERLRHRVAALEAETALLGQQAALGLGGAEAAATLGVAEQALVAVRTELAQAHARWQQQADLASRIAAVRQTLLDSPATPQPDTRTAAAGSRTMLADLERQWRDAVSGEPLALAEVGQAVVADVLADWTGIPVRRMVRDDVQAVFGLHPQLEARVIGQPAATRAIADRVQAAKAGLTDPDKPVGVFLLVGPSGVGKTETALALADALYGGPQNMVTINMSEFQEPHTVSTLKGSPPGYVGYGEGGVLTEAVRRRPYSVVLLDEVEKAHPDVHELFFQVFDKGWMEDGEGRRIDFRNCTILLTSNAGAEALMDAHERGALDRPQRELQDLVLPSLRRVFPAAFLGRTTVIPYRPLEDSALDTIVGLQLARVARRLQEQHGIALRHDADVAAHLVRACGAHETGVRRLITLIEQDLLPELARCWLEALAEGRALEAIALGLAEAPTQDTATAMPRIRCMPHYADVPG